MKELVLLGSCLKLMKQVAQQEMKKLLMKGEQQGLLAGVASMLLAAGILTFIRRK